MASLSSLGISDSSKKITTGTSVTMYDLVVIEIQDLKQELNSTQLNEAVRTYHVNLNKLKETIPLSALRKEHLPMMFRELLLEQLAILPKNW